MVTVTLDMSHIFVHIPEYVYYMHRMKHVIMCMYIMHIRYACFLVGMHRYILYVHILDRPR